MTAFDSCTLEIEFTAGVWTDVTAYLKLSSGLRIRQGRATEYEDISPAEMSFTLKNEDGRFMPDNGSSPYWPNVIEDIRVRFKVTKSAVTYTRFQGWIRSWAPDFPSSYIYGATVAVTATDALGLLGRVKFASHWTEQILATVAAAGGTVDVFEPTGGTNGLVTSMRNYAEDASRTTSTGIATSSWPMLSVEDSSDLSVGKVLVANPDSAGDSSSVLLGIRTTTQVVQFLVKTPTSIPGSGVNVWLTTLTSPSFVSYFNMAFRGNGTNVDLYAFNGTPTSLGAIKTNVPRGQWILVTLQRNAGTPTNANITATVLSDGTTSTLTNVGVNLATGGYGQFTSAQGSGGPSSFGGFAAMSTATPVDYKNSYATNTSWTLSTKVDAFMAALVGLPVTSAKSGSLALTAVTGYWSDRWALDVAQEIMRTGLGVVWARSRDSTIYWIDAASCRPRTPLVTLDIDADCDGPPVLSRGVQSRPTRVEVKSARASASTVRINTTAEAATGTQQPLTVSTVCATLADAQAVGDYYLYQSSALRISQLRIDMESAATDYTATLFDESGALTGLFPTARIRTIVPVSHFGEPTADHYVQGWEENYSPRSVTLTLDTTPAVPVTLASETWTGSNGTAWPAQWTTTFGTATGSSSDIQSNRGRITSGASGNRYGLRLNTTWTDVEITGLIQVTATSEAQIYWRADSTVVNGYYLRIAVAGVAVNRVVAGSFSTLFTMPSAPAISAATDYLFRIRQQGIYLCARVWAASGAEPGTWQVNSTDATFTSAGYVGLANWTVSQSSLFDDLVITTG